MKLCTILIGSLLFLLVSCVSQQTLIDRDLAGLFEKNSELYSDQRGPRKFDQSSLMKMASSRAMKMNEARLILDNDAAFESKINLIRNANKEIRMVYYIFATDNSSAVMTQELVKKAASGVKVNLLVDMITNFGQIDLFKWMEKEGKGNLKVHFYNFPTEQIRLDAVYLSLPCPILEKPSAFQCSDYKSKIISRMGSQKSNLFSRMLLAGLYGKNATTLKVALSVGAGIDPANYKNGPTDEESLKQLLELLNIIKEAYLKDSLIAKIKLSIAMATQGESVNPVINELTGRIPITNSIASAEQQAREWDHITDYTHHKLIVVDGSAFQLGGRNIEDSYHMKRRVSGHGKYIFMDTDFYGKGSASQVVDIEAAFDKLISIKGMIAGTDQIEKEMAVDLMKNPDELMMATTICIQNKTEDLSSCIEQKVKEMPGYKSSAKRQVIIASEIQKLSSDYYAIYKTSYRDTWKSSVANGISDSLSKQDLESAQFFYLENLPYSREDKKPKRNFGSRVGVESKYSKNIHEAWYRGLENACRASHIDKKDVRIVFHNAYVFLPTGLIYRLSKMINGDYGDCSRVRITFLSNSLETTDLNIINIFARYQLKDLFQYYSRVKESFELTKKNVAPRVISQMYPELDYFEYNKAAAGDGLSLHTKLTLIGNDLIVGSANADTRSYFMDTNNAILIRNAQELNRDYSNYIDRLIKDSKLTKSMVKYFSSLTDEKIQDENEMILKEFLQRWDKKGRLQQKHQARILKDFNQLGQRISGDTRKILDYRRLLENAQFENNSIVSEVEKELNDTSNRFDDLFKLL